MLKPLSYYLSCDKDEILSSFGSIYEHSPWVAEILYDNHLGDKEESITTIRELFELMKNIVESSSDDKKLALLRVIPDLCENISNMTNASQEEQSRAGLQCLTEGEKDTFLSCNKAYKAKYGFPFILAVRNASKYTVLSAIRARVHNAKEVEFITALKQVHKIAWMRLLGAISIEVPKGFLTCHVLDTANGCPGELKNSHCCLFWYHFKTHCFSQIIFGSF